MHNASGPALGRRSVIYLESHTVWCLQYFGLVCDWVSGCRVWRRSKNWARCLIRWTRCHLAWRRQTVSPAHRSVSPVYHHQSTSHSPNTLWGTTRSSTATGARRTTDTQTDRQKDIIIAQSPLPDMWGETLKCIMAAGID